jgi:bis(5'-nucleosidyl)-tetraphosphatase
MKRKSAGIIPVRQTIDQNWEFLILRCYNYWDFPKGEVEPHEDDLTAAKRELKEETGITEITFPWGEVVHETAPYARGKVAIYYLGLIPQGSKVQILPNPITGIQEHHEYRWVKIEEAKTLFGPRLKNVLLWAHDILSSTE